MNIKIGMCLFFAILALFLCLTPGKSKSARQGPLPALRSTCSSRTSTAQEFLQAAMHRPETRYHRIRPNGLWERPGARFFFCRSKGQIYLR